MDVYTNFTNLKNSIKLFDLLQRAPSSSGAGLSFGSIDEYVIEIRGDIIRRKVTAWGSPGADANVSELAKLVRTIGERISVELGAEAFD